MFKDCSKVKMSVFLSALMLIVLFNLCTVNIAYAIDLDTVTVTSDTTAKKQIKSSKITVTMNNQGYYAIMLNDGSGTKNAFYNGETSGTSNIDVWDDNGKRSWYSIPIEANSFSISNNVIKMSRVQAGVARYTLMLSIVNATSEGGYMKVEMKMENLKATSQDMGVFIYWDTMIDTNDGSPFEVITNGWRNYDNGFQVSAFFKDTMHVTNADALWMGTWGTERWDDNASMSWLEQEGMIGQPVTSDDTAAAAWYNPSPVAVSSSRTISTIIGVGPKNEAPVLTSPTFDPEMEGGTFDPGDEVIIGGTAGNSDDVGTEMDIISIVDDNDAYRQVLGTVTVLRGEQQNFQYTYTIPTGLSPGQHTLKVYLMDDTGVTSTLEAVTFYIADVDSVPPTISGAAAATVEAGGSFDPMTGVTAADTVDGDVTANIQVTGAVNTSVPGSYTLTYSVTDAAGNTATTTRTITVADTTGATISGAAAATVEAGSSFDPMTGVTASDTVDGDVTANIQVTGTVNTGVPGSYTLTYSVTDAAGNTATATRVITVADTTGATISGAAAATVEAGGSFDPMTGVTASDTVDGDVTANIQVTGTVNTSVPGSYTLTYSITDAAGNTATTTRTITVADTTAATISGAAAATVEAGGSFDPMTGVTAADTVDGDVTANIQVTGTVNTGVPGSYTLTYSITDAAGNAATATRVITVADTTGATISGAAAATVEAGGSFDPMTGVTASDVVDGDVTANIQVTGTVNTGVPGSYTLTYSITDAAGNAATATRVITVADTTAAAISGAAAATVEAGGSFDPMSGVTASDVVDGDVTASIQVTGTVNTGIPGSYTLTYSITDAAGNTATATRVITVADTIAATISGATAATVEAGSSFDPMTGVTAADVVDGDVTANIQVTGTVNTGVPGSYTLTYSITDAAGNTATATRTITVADTTGATISGAAAATVEAGSSFDPMTGVTAADVVDGDVTANIQVTGTVDENVPGSYTLTYSITDAAGNAATATRVITVADTTAATISGASAETVEAGGSFDPMTGVTASDVVDGDVTANIQVTGAVNTGVPGSYTLTYSITDAAGNAATATRVITVADTTGATISGAAAETVEAGGSFDPMTGVTASDVVDGDVTASIQVTGTVNTGIPGSYTLTYSITDAAGNTATATRVITVADTTGATISGAAAATVEAGSSFDPMTGVTAADVVDGDVTANIQVTGTVNTGVPGSYTLTYSITDAAGNTATATRVITVADTTGATISGAAAATVEAGSSFDPMTGVTAADVVDGDVTANIQVTGTVNTGVPGSYTLTYSITDAAGNAATATRTITVADTTGATISGASAATVEAGGSFDPMSGVTASDVVDGDVTASIQVTGTVNTGVPGSYTLTYSITDAAGNAATATRVITVADTTGATISGAAAATVEAGSSFDPMAGVTASDVVDGDVTASIQVTGTVNTGVPGSYTLTYSITDAAGNAATATRTITVADTTGATISGASAATVEAGGSFDPMSGVTASDVVDGDVTASIQVTGTVNTGVPGSYTLTYSITDAAGNAATATRVITVADTTGATISGAAAATVEAGSSFDPMSGVTASDVVDGDVTASIQVTGTVNTGVPGSYTLTYSITDAAGNAATATRTITVADTTGATISGESAATVEAGGSFDPMSGVTASDVVDGDVTASIQVTGTVNTGVPGSYTLTYSITDAAGNAATATRTITVADTTVPGGYSVSINQTVINSTYAPAVSFSFSGAEVGSTFSYTLTSSEGGVPVSGTGIITSATQQVTGIDVRGLADGIVNLSAVLTDAAGNSGNAATDIVEKDTEIPLRPTIEKPIEDDGIVNEKEKKDVSIKGTAEASTGIEVVFEDTTGTTVKAEITTDVNGSWSLGENGLNLSSLKDGNITITVTSTDDAGNKSLEEQETVLLDTESPKIVSFNKDTDDWTNKDVEITAVINDGNGSGISVTKFVYGAADEAYFQTGGIEFNGKFTVSENNIYTVYAKDTAGNESTEEVEATNIDKQNPTEPVIYRMPDRDFYNGNFIISIASGDDNGSGVAQSVYRQVYGSYVTDWGIYNGPITVSRIGTTRIEAKTIDNAGNMSGISEESVAISKELKVFPTLIIDPDKEYSNEDYTVSITKENDNESVTEAVYAKVYYKITGMNDFAVYDQPFVINKEGTYEISVMVVDRSGNQMTVTKAVYLDKSLPVSENSILVADRIITQKDASTISINGTGDSTDTIWLAPLGTENFVEGSSMKKVDGNSSTINVPSIDGEYRLYVVDRAGNISLPSEKKVIVDRTPSVIYGVENDEVCKEYRTITFSDGNAQLNGQPFTSGNTVEKNGTYTLIVTDQYGNSTTVSFTVDNDAETVKNSKDTLNIIYQKGNGVEKVTKDVTLTDELENGVIVTWESSNKDIMGDDGKFVNSPLQNTQITLTATLKKGSAIETKVFTITVFADVTAPTINLKGDSTVVVEKGDLYVEKGYTASDDVDGNLTDKVSIEGYFNTGLVGTYTITYKVTDSSGNEGSTTRTIRVIEKETPKEATIVAEDEEKIDDTKLKDAIQGAKEQDSDNVKIVVEDNVTRDNPVQISIGKKQVENAKNSDVNILFETGNTSILVPIDAIDISSMGTNSRLKLVCEQVDTADPSNSEMVEAVKKVNESMQIYENKVFDFKMRVVEEDDQGNQIKDEEVKNFTSQEDISLRIVVGEVEGTKALMTFYFNPQTGEWEYVRGKYIKSLGSVEISTNHLSIYSVMELTPEQKREELTKLINDPDITVKEVLNIVEDEDIDLGEYTKYALFEDSQKTETAQGVIDGKATRVDNKYADYNDFEGEFNSIVTRIYNSLYNDLAAPELTLIGDNSINIYIGSTYSEYGAKAVDNIEGDITGRIVVTGEVDTYTIGEYTIKYTITDLAGNTSTLKRIVKVHAKTKSAAPASGGGVASENADNNIKVTKGQENIEAKKSTSASLNTNDKDMKFASSVYEVVSKTNASEVEGQVRVNYDESKVTNEDHLSVFVYDEKTQKWKCLGGIVDKANNYITLNMDTSGKVAVIELNRTFNDMADHWAKDVVEILAARQVIDGDGLGNFNPNMGITRAEFAAIITKAMDIPITSDKAGFEDINSEDWFAPYITAARNAGIVKGISETKYEPQRIVSREEMTAMVMRAYRLVKEVDLGAEQISSVEKFEDSQKIGNWAYDDVYTAKCLNLVQGRSKDYFVPESETLRGEAAMLIYRFLKALDKI